MNEFPELDRDDDLLRALLTPLERVPSVALPDAGHQSRRSARARIARRLVLVLLLAAAALVIALIAPWGHGSSFTQGAVAERALVAIGDGPVLHVVLRQEGGLKGGGWSYIDLASGKETPMTDTREIWYDSERHFEHMRWGIEGASASAQEGLFAEREILQTPSGTWASYNIDPGKPHAPVLEPALSEFLDGYRSALENGTARVTGSGTVDGHDVTWIELAVTGALCAAQPCAERVAIDKTSSLPLSIAWYFNGKFGHPIEIASIETLPAGSGDFSRPEKNADISFRSREDQVASITSSDAAHELPGAVWLGNSFSNLELTNVSRATLTSQTLRSEQAWKTVTETGIELHYGNGSPSILWSKPTPVNGAPSGGDVVVQEEKADPDFFFWPYPAAPEGSMLTNNGGEGWLVKNGIYIFIETFRNQKLLLAAVSALEPIQASAGTG
jgi:hypothetical protein